MLKNWNEAFLLQKNPSTKPGLLLVKNPKYWKRDIINRSLPYLDAVAVSLIQDRDQVFRNFEQGKLDFINSLSAASRRKVLNNDGSIQQVFKNKYVVEKKPYMITEYLGFLLEGTDQKANPLLSVKVRKALSYAINRKTLVSFTNGGLGIPGSSGFVPASIASFDSTRVNGHNFNTQRAQQLLKEAGYPQGKGFPNITLNTYNTDKKLCAFLQTQWQKYLGIKVRLKTQSYAEHKGQVDNGQVKFFRGSWIGDYPDAENFLAMFYSKFVAPTGPNKTRFNNPTFDKLFIESQETDNTFTRYANYYKMDQLIMDKAPVIVLYYGEVLNLKQKNITGLKTNTMNTMILEKTDIK